MDTRKAVLAPLATLRQCSNMSSSMTSDVSSMPSATIARLSPTRIISMPTCSATCALGKSCAVTIVIGSFFLCMAINVGMVILGRKGVVGEALSGECADEREVVVERARREGDRRLLLHDEVLAIGLDTHLAVHLEPAADLVEAAAMRVGMRGRARDMALTVAVAVAVAVVPVMMIQYDRTRCFFQPGS